MSYYLGVHQGYYIYFFGEIQFKHLLRILFSSLLLLFITGCSSSSTLTGDMILFSQEEKSNLQKEDFLSLDISMQNEIIVWEQTDVSGFITDNAFETFKENTQKTTTIEDLHTILVSFSCKEESSFQSIQVYLDENSGKALGFLTEEKEE